MSKTQLRNDALLGLALTVLFFFAIELTLAAAGLGEAPETINYSRGFDPGAAYLIPNPEIPGGWRTQFEAKGQREKNIPPRTERIRVEMFGGSNTANCPAGYLRTALQELAGPRSYEAINLGRTGYGSARVRLILEQALAKTDPDIVIIYAGHNEFVERGFQLDLEASVPSGWAEGPAKAARKTRLFHAFVEQYSKEPKVSPQSKPEAWEWEYKKFADITYAETLQYLAQYEANLRAMCLRSRESGAEVMLCTIVHNRMSMPFSSAYDAELSAESRSRCDAWLAEAKALYPDYLVELLPRRESERVHGYDFGRGDNPKTMGDDVLEGWRETSGVLAGREAKLQVEARWTPLVRKLDRCLIRFHAQELGDRKASDLERAEALLDEVLAVSEDHPRALFEKGLVGYLLGRDPASVVECFERAASFDRAPRKGSELINDLVRKVASEVDGVHLLDVDAIFRECHPMGLVGWEWMIDHCHLSYGAREVLMEIFAREIFELWPPQHFRGER